MTMLDIDCFEHGKTCEILATEDHNEYIAGDDVNVVQEGTKITETAKSYLIGEGPSVGTFCVVVESELQSLI